MPVLSQYTRENDECHLNLMILEDPLVVVCELHRIVPQLGGTLGQRHICVARADVTKNRQVLVVTVGHGAPQILTNRDTPPTTQPALSQWHAH